MRELDHESGSKWNMLCGIRNKALARLKDCNVSLCRAISDDITYANSNESNNGEPVADDSMPATIERAAG